MASPDPDWPNDVEVPLHGGFLDFGEIRPADARAIAIELEEQTGWGPVIDGGGGEPSTEGRLWRSLADELEGAGVEQVRELDFERRFDLAQSLLLPQPGWALRAKRRGTR
jgi:hypothetical protein